ncbi:FAD-dependent thymidylate synthase [Patescibacteria group bacterium]|nr:FAD-dependent thymidylate synthase [Patescibacteria group bacterium]MBU1673507.1 FAD-dependent thymidylate synthase [Patescibacteria group bacterium]MBU1963747.1 FAD-dependent thymidylate synthase [Patescibacteria group bacterium]
MPEAELKVTLISYTKDPEQTVCAAIRQCYSNKGGTELKEKTKEEVVKRLIKQIISSGHTSTIEHANFTFAVEGVSRALTHQLVRHRIASFSQQSQRYVEEKGELDYIIPPKIRKDKKALEKYEADIKKAHDDYKALVEQGIDKEDARYLLPNAAETKIVITMNARSLLNFFEKRLCTRAQWEIRRMANKMLDEVKPVAPTIFKYAGPTCETEKICWEGDLNCGKWEIIEGAELRSKT